MKLFSFDKFSLIGLGLTAAGGVLSIVKEHSESKDRDQRMKAEIARKVDEYMASRMEEESEEEETEEEP